MADERLIQYLMFVERWNDLRKQARDRNSANWAPREQLLGETTDEFLRAAVAPDLGGADLRGSDLQGADLRDANLRHAHLRNANLRHARLRNVDLTGADLRNANLAGADLRDADLRDANLRGASLVAWDNHEIFDGALLGGAKIGGADFRDCAHLDAQIKDAIGRPVSGDSAGSQHVAIAWSPETLNPEQYAELIKALGDIGRSQGAAGLKRVESQLIRSKVGAGVLV